MEFSAPVARGRLDIIEQLSCQFVEDQAAHNVVYTEVRYSPQLLTAQGSHGSGQSVSLEDSAEVVAAVTRGLRSGCEKHGVIVNQILCMISHRPDWASDTVELAIELGKLGRVRYADCLFIDN